MELSIITISAISVLIPTVIGLVMMRKLRPTLRILYAFVLLTLVIEVISLVTNLYGINNLYLFHSYAYIEFAAISWIFYRLFDRLIWRRIVLLFLIVFVVFSVVNVTFYESLGVFNSNQRYLEGMMVLTLNVVYFTQLMRKADERSLIRYPYFWLNSGLLIYFSGTLFLFLASKELMRQDSRSYFEIHGILNIGLNIIYSVTFLLGRRK